MRFLIPAAIVAMLAFGTWFVCTHECVAEHTEQRMSCSTTSFDVGSGIGVGNADCSPYTATVCDEWRRRP